MPVGDAAHRPAEDLPGAGLRQGSHHVHPAQRGDRADLVPDQLDEFRGDGVRICGDAGLQDGETAGDLALELVVHADHRAFGDGGMTGQYLFHLARGQPVPGDVDDVVGAAHHIEVAVGVAVASVAGDVCVAEPGQVRV